MSFKEIQCSKNMITRRGNITLEKKIDHKFVRHLTKLNLKEAKIPDLGVNHRRSIDCQHEFSIFKMNAVIRVSRV